MAVAAAPHDSVKGEKRIVFAQVRTSALTWDQPQGALAGDRTSVSVSVDKAKRQNPTWKRRRLSPSRNTSAFLPHLWQDDQGKCWRRSLRKKGGRTELNRIRTDQTALANLALPTTFRTGCSLRTPWLMRNATDFHFLRQLVRQDGFCSTGFKSRFSETHRTSHSR